MGIFNRGAEIKALNARINELETKGYYTPDNEANEYLKRLLWAMGRTVDFGDYNRNDLYDIYRSSSAVFGIIDKIATAVSECAAYIELLDENDTPIEKHWILDLLAHPNDRYNRARFLYAWATNYDVFGDAFVYFDRNAVGSKIGQIRGMYIPAGNRVLIEKGGVRFPISRGRRMRPPSPTTRTSRASATTLTMTRSSASRRWWLRPTMRRC